MDKNIEPTIILSNGRRRWLFPDGTMLPVVSGGNGAEGANPTTEVGFNAGVIEAASGSSVPSLTIPINTTPAPQTSHAFTSDDIAKARREEKDKLYPKIEELQEQLKQLQADRDARMKAEEDARRKAEEEVERARLAELSAQERLAEQQRALEERLRQVEEDRERERATFEMERAYAQLVNYRDQRVNAEVAAGNIAPELADLVSGNSVEEVEAAITRIAEKTAVMVGNMQAAATQQRSTQRGPSYTSPPVGPMETQQAFTTLTPDQIRNMDMATYIKERDKLLKANSDQVRTKGIYGY